MKRAKYINSENVEIIDYENCLSNIEKTFNDFIIKNKITDEEIKILENKTDSESVNLIRLRKLANKERQEEISLLDNYLEYVPCEHKELPKYASRKIYYTKDNSKIYEHEIIIHNDKDIIEHEISLLKNELSSTDYVIIKQYEAKIMLIDYPYSDEEISEICKKRKKLRDKINELQNLL